MPSYIAVIHKDKDSEYGISFPDFPGCIAAGHTVDEAKDMAQEALQFHCDGIADDSEHMPIPSHLEEVIDADAIAYFIVSITPKKRDPIRVNCSFDPLLLHAMDLKARECGMTRSSFIANAIRKELHMSGIE